MVDGQVDRRVVEVVAARMREVPVVVLQGPRSVGSRRSSTRLRVSTARRSSTWMCPGCAAPYRPTRPSSSRGLDRCSLMSTSACPTSSTRSRPKSTPTIGLAVSAHRIDPLRRAPAQQSSPDRSHPFHLDPAVLPRRTRRGPRRLPRHRRHRTRTASDRDRPSAQP